MRRLCTYVTAGMVLAAPAPAVGHGPCGCLDPVLVEPGKQVQIAGAGLAGLVLGTAAGAKKRQAGRTIGL